MSRIVCYLPSYNDSELLKQSLASIPEWEVVISDNASDEPHRSALAGLAGDRVQVVRQEKSLGRVGNWKFCVQHFIDSDASWMKFLCAGDVHKPDSLAIYRRAIERHPQVKYILGQIDNVWTHRRIRWALTPTETLVQPAQAMAATAIHGNVFHGLLAPIIHRDALRDGFSFGEETLSYCADMLFLVQIAQRTPTLYLTDLVADFVVANRRSFLAMVYTLEHCLEEGLIRLRAADSYLALTGDREARNQLVRRIVAWVNESLRHPPEKLTGDLRYTPEQMTGDAPT